MTGPDQIEPYTIRLRLNGRFDDPPALVAGFLEDLAQRCEHAGASVIGHLKAHARTPRGSLHCNLTSRRSGAHCAGVLAERPRPADALDLDLAVLVYGLPRDVLATLVDEAAERLRERGLIDWAPLAVHPTAQDGPGHDHPHHQHRRV